ncbi:hypothetical protein I6G51_06360 [Corynebacterium minutissimum]|uniref:PPE family protein n=1 Tax=Corynebacterium minutissimum TaxID=38301 RepID=A0A2X4RAC9_9CORY|nr:hypothetical protein NX84_05545 [Corynebacterium minutissimum]QPS58580.1 hypothetical protein I6G51_06360 [Corynebacterium minutissimum]QQA78428.1 hypothetical protein I6H49_06495 [Corynebacterium minutissimum]SQI00317.1 Uncharacterised protein [Corynebacterium minutissimum]VEG05616.1 Uncharacterised protein [Corynebacterium minutissimum]
MQINQINLLAQVSGIKTLSEQLNSAVGTANSPLNSGFSPVIGVRDVGGIHERVLTNDPGSAQNSLQGFNSQVAWLADTLQTELAGFESQDELNSRGLDVPDAGGGGGAEAMPIVEQPDPGYSPFGFTMPVVDPGASIMGLASDLFTTRFWDVSEAQARWRTLSVEVGDIVEGLHASAASLESENDSEPTTRAAAKIREVAQAGTHFIANSEVMQQKLFGLQARIMSTQAEAVALAFEVMAIPEPATRAAAERAALLHMQGLLQEGVVMAMPYQHALMDAAPPSGGGDVSTEFGAVAGDGTQYNTDGVTWPKQIAEAIESGEVGPGSFDAANGQMKGLSELGMDAAEIAQFQSDLRNRGRSILSELGFGEALEPIDASQMNTSAATAGVSSVNPVGGVQAANGQALSAAGLGSGAGAGASGMGALGLPGGRGSTAGSLTGGMPRGINSGMNSGINRALGRIPENPLTSAAGLGGAGASASAPQTGTHPVIGGLPGAAASGGVRDGRASASAGGAGGSVAGPIGGAVGGAGNNGASVVAKSGANVTKGAAGIRMMPMMGGAGRGGENEKRIKSVTTQVERDPNKRDLLGESPAVLPGVIGEWARDGD